MITYNEKKYSVPVKYIGEKVEIKPKNEIKNVIKQIQKESKSMQKKIRADMYDYVKKAFKAALK